ncbi:DEAD/DEAH box helicase [Gordonibacter massiliensis (ex Traore et al. 2017)]|uniref:DEAD/DEAH box helicase n=1 Tax=Gordonibacter massiliensis (ex Traore et al. 2017) TaxID=1841863 RepID=UPI0021B055B8|nr:DEAD/DEAH box helicase [Gordonibacter massiliensis (ex Traore et al. 2017)]
MDAANDALPHAALDRFSEAVRDWFLEAFPGPTPVQERAWEAIEDGENALVIAPTGSGKTLAAFLFAIDALMREKAGEGRVPGVGGAADDGAAGDMEGAAPTKPAKGVRVLYVSPLKALGADVERNLQAPLAGIAARLAAEGAKAPSVRTGMRTGDTTPDQRRSLLRNPPDILITTPESLYLMLTSQARETLRTVETVIVDEVHALAGNKRGAHLALSLERLDDLLEQPAQRVGLSATVRPREEVARFLGGPHPVSVIAAEGRPDLDVRVVVPVRDMTAIPTFPGADAHGAGGRVGGPRRAPAEEAWKSDRALRAHLAGSSGKGATPDSRAGSSSIWPLIEASILDEVLAHRTTIVFVNSRGLCEKLTARLNELYAKREGLLAPGNADDGASSHIRSDLGSTSELAQGAPEIIAKAHHGSVSKEKRLQVERELKSGELPCVVATSSLELGIDMGSIDLVLQVAAPPSVASGLQRIGRANHQVGGRSAGSIYPRTRTEIIDAAVVAEGMRAGSIEATALVRNPLDVLAQQTVAAVAMGGATADGWYETVRRAAPFSELPRRAFDSVLDMLSGRYASADLAEFAPRIVWDRESGALTPRPSAQRLAVTAAGTIPDRGMFSVVLPEGDGNEGRRRVGELDEEMVYESRVGDIIALGTSSWRISEITRDRVIVEPAPGRSARLPFWHGEGVGRPAETGRARGAFLRALAAGIDDELAGEADLLADAASRLDPALRERLAADGLDEDAQRNLAALVRAQREATGTVPDDKTLVVERCEDETGDWRVMLHSPYGRRVHEPWAMAVQDRVESTLGFDPQAMAADDGILLRVPMTETRLPGAELFVFDPDELVRVVRDRVDKTALFAARFRECAARALLMSPTRPGKRAPLWQQRLKAGQLLETARGERDFPILLETARECLQDVYDLGALHELMEGLAAGAVRVVEAQTSIPSPFAGPLLFGYVGEHLYQGDLPHAERRASLLSLDPALLGELLGSADMAELLDAQVVAEVEEKLQRTAPDRRARGAEGAADLLRVLGPLSTEEVALRLEPPQSVGSQPGAETPGTEALGMEAAGREVPEMEASVGALSRAPVPAQPENIGQAASADKTPAQYEDKTPSGSLAGEHPNGHPADEYPAGHPIGGHPGGHPADEASLCHPERPKGVEGSPAAAAESAGETAAADEVQDDGATAAPHATPDEALAVLEELQEAKRAFLATIGGAERWAAVEDAGRLREALGTAVPAWVPAAFLEAADDRAPLDDLLARYARTHGPFADEEAAARFGIGPAVARESLRRLAASGKLVQGRFGQAPGGEGERGWVSAEVFRRLRSLSLAKARAAVRAVPPDAYVRYVLDLQGVGDGAALEGVDGVAQVIAQFEGVFLPAAAWEGSVFPSRVRDYRPSMLDELIASGDVVWAGARREGDGASDDGRARGRSAQRKATSPSTLVAFYPTDSPLAPVRPDAEDAPFEAVVDATASGPSVEEAVVEALGSGYGLFFRQIADAVRRRMEPERVGEAAVAEALLDLAWSGRATNDTFAPVRAVDAGSSAARQRPAPKRRASSRRSGRRYAVAPAAGGGAARVASEGFGAPAAVCSGRWSLLAPSPENDTVRALALVESILDRYGVLSRDVAALAGASGGLGALMPVLRQMEDAGDVLRGVFVKGLGPAQFAARETVDVLRAYAGGDEAAERGESRADRSTEAVVLAADDPASLFGCGVPWPPLAASGAPAACDEPAARPSRRPGSLVCVRGGRLALYATAGLRSILSFTEDPEALRDAVAALVAHAARAARREGAEGARKKLAVESFNGLPVLSTPFADVLQEAGLVRLPDGMRLYVDPFSCGV